jgi:hypothetical protein
MCPSDPNDKTADDAATSSLNSLSRERLKFADFRFTRSPSGQCSADVTLDWESNLHTGARSEIGALGGDDLKPRSVRSKTSPKAPFISSWSV